MCSWKLWNARLVSMLPDPGALLTVMTPSLTTHFAGALSDVFTHSSRFLPSNRTIASDGGAESAEAGVTTLGSGSHTSVSWGLAPLCRPRPGLAACCAPTSVDRI